MKSVRTDRDAGILLRMIDRNYRNFIRPLHPTLTVVAWVEDTNAKEILAKIVVGLDDGSLDQYLGVMYYKIE